MVQIDSTHHYPLTHHLFSRHEIQELQAIERDMQQIDTPVAFTGLHELSTETVQAFATWSTQVMNGIGALSSDTIAAAQVSRQAALDALDALRQALARHPPGSCHADPIVCKLK